MTADSRKTDKSPAPTRMQRPKRANSGARLPISVIDACRDADIFGRWFEGPSWTNWFVFLKVVFGLKLDGSELAVFQKFTERSAPLPGGHLEATVIVGRRGGKSLALALIAAYLSAFHDWSPYLTGGERGTVMIVSADRKSARSIFRYLKEMLSIPLLASLVERETQETLDLSNGITVEILAGNFRTIRGRTVVTALLDEEAFWPTDEGLANPDVEVVNAIRPSMATIPTARLLKASSPHAKKGDLYDDFKRYYGQDDSPVLVWKASTRDMNPAISEAYIARQYDRDPAHAAAEYGANFRDDVASWLSLELIEAAVDNGVTVRPPQLGKFVYHAGIDPSGGARDSYTAAVSHAEGNQIVLDALLEIRPPFDPSVATEQVVALLKSYGLSNCTGDRYAAQLAAKTNKPTPIVPPFVHSVPRYFPGSDSNFSSGPPGGWAIGGAPWESGQ